MCQAPGQIDAGKTTVNVGYLPLVPPYHSLPSPPHKDDLRKRTNRFPSSLASSWTQPIGDQKIGEQGHSICQVASNWLHQGPQLMPGGLLLTALLTNSPFLCPRVTGLGTVS